VNSRYALESRRSNDVDFNNLKDRNRPKAAPRDIDLLCISNDLLSLKISFRNFETMQNANDALKIFWPIRPIKKGRHSDPFYLDS